MNKVSENEVLRPQLSVALRIVKLSRRKLKNEHV